MSKNLRLYQQAVDEYLRAIFIPGWHLGPQKKLTEKAAALHDKLSEEEKAVAEKFQWMRYEELIG